MPLLLWWDALLLLDTLLDASDLVGRLNININLLLPSECAESNAERAHLLAGERLYLDQHAAFLPRCLVC